MAEESEAEVNVRRHPSVDRGYAWVVLVASVLLNILVEGAFSGMSVLVVELKYHFDAPESAIIGIGGILLSIGFIFSKYFLSFILISFAFPLSIIFFPVFLVAACYYK